VYVRVANPTSEALNPGFDVTPAELIKGIITPVGILEPHELWAQRRELGCALGNKDLRAR
jgi:methylthioribose-1-phosphate isomerase